MCYSTLAHLSGVTEIALALASTAGQRGLWGLGVGVGVGRKSLAQPRYFGIASDSWGSRQATVGPLDALPVGLGLLFSLLKCSGRFCREDTNVRSCDVAN